MDTEINRVHDPFVSTSEKTDILNVTFLRECDGIFMYFKSKNTRPCIKLGEKKVKKEVSILRIKLFTYDRGL